MKLNEYQLTSKKYILNNLDKNINYLALGLCGESGEVAEKVKKGIRDGNEDVEGIKKELGDVLWYIAQLSSYYCISLEDIAKLNINKLELRLKNNTIQGNGDNR